MTSCTWTVLLLALKLSPPQPCQALRVWGTPRVRFNVFLPNSAVTPRDTKLTAGPRRCVSRATAVHCAAGRWLGSKDDRHGLRSHVLRHWKSLRTLLGRSCSGLVCLAGGRGGGSSCYGCCLVVLPTQRDTDSVVVVVDVADVVFGVQGADFGAGADAAADVPALGRAGRSESLKDRRRRRRVGRGRGGVLGSALCPGPSAVGDQLQKCSHPAVQLRWSRRTVCLGSSGSGDSFAAVALLLSL